MRSILVWVLRVVFAFVFIVLSTAAFHLYPLPGAIVFAATIGFVFLWVLHQINKGFRSFDRSRFLREYNNRPGYQS